jgi:hypothetical protein
MRRLIAAALAAALCAVPLFASGADGGIYIGAGAGRGHIEENAVGFDSNGTAYKGFIGYRLGALPIVDLAVELGYTDFGHPAQDTSLGQRVEYKLRGASAAGLLILPIGPIDLFAKAGGVRWSSERTINGTASNRNGTTALVGAGIGLRVWRIGLRAEYEYFDVKNIDRADMLSVSAIFQF